MTIRVGVDGSGPSRAALAWAAKRAASEGSALELVHVVDGEWGQVGQQAIDDETDAGTQVLAEAIEHARRYASDVTTTLLHGSVAWELATATTPGDLLVVGTHTTGYLSGRALGTRSIVVASVARSSVAVIPDTPVTGRRGVVVGVASGTAWESAVTWGASEAVRLGNELSLVHAAAAGDEGHALLADAAALASGIHPALVIRRRVSRRRPSEALLDASRSAGLLVLGPTHETTARAGFLGSTTHEVLLNINAPVVVARS